MAVPEKTQYIRIRYRDAYRNCIGTANVEITNETECAIYGYAINYKDDDVVTLFDIHAPSLRGDAQLEEHN